MRPPDKSGGRIGWFLKLAAGLLIFWIAFRDVDPRAAARAFSLVEIRWLMIAIGSVFVTVGFVVMRWRVLLGPAVVARHYAVLASSVIASQVSNIVMPFRLGDAVRIGAVSRALSLPAPAVLASVAVERLLDMLLVAVTAALLVGMDVLPPFARDGMLWLGVTLGVGLAALCVITFWRAAIGTILSPVGRAIPERMQTWLVTQADLLFRGLLHIQQPRVAASAVLWGAAVMLGSILTVVCLLFAFDIDAPVWSAVVIVIVLQIGSVVVPIPGAVGISQVLTVQTLMLWGVAEAPSLAFALMLYFVSRVPKLAVLPLALGVLARRVERAP